MAQLELIVGDNYTGKTDDVTAVELIIFCALFYFITDCPWALDNQVGTEKLPGLIQHRGFDALNKQADRTHASHRYNQRQQEYFQFTTMPVAKQQARAQSKIIQHAVTVHSVTAGSDHSAVPVCR